MPSSPNVFIHGSCVSRDTAEWFPSAGLDLLDYVARQSLVSTMSSKPEAWQSTVIDEALVPSNFQRRAVEADLRASGRTELALVAPQVDIILHDLVDERGGFIRVDTGVVTNSIELARSNVLPTLGPDPVLVKFGSDDHFQSWSEAWAGYLSYLAEKGLREKLIVMEHLWADESIEGDVFPFGTSNIDPNRMNSLLTRYYDTIRDSGVTILTMPAELCVTTAEHRWGIAPSHYAAEFYGFAVREIARLRHDA